MNVENDIRISLEVEAPGHIKWGKPYIKGAPRCFFIPSVHFGREIAELLQRIDANYESLTIDKLTSLNVYGFGDFYGTRGAWDDFDILYNKLEKVLVSEEHFDVMIIPSVSGWGFFTEKTREEIMRRVQEGAGLVMIQPFPGEPYENVDVLEELSPLKPLYKGGKTNSEERNTDLDKLAKGKWLPEKHYITNGIPFEIFPYNDLAYFPYEGAGEVIIKADNGDPIAAVSQYGKGRVVAFGYYARDVLPQHSDYTGWDACYEPIVANWHGARMSTSFNYLEYFYSLINRSIIWVAKLEPDNYIKAWTRVDDNIKLSMCTVDNKTHELYYIVKDLYDNVVYDGHSNINEIKLDEKLKSGGDYRAEVYLKSNVQIEDWASIPFSYKLESEIQNITVDCDHIKPGTAVKIEIETKGEAGELTVHILDDYDRVIELKSYAVSQHSIKFDYIPQAGKSMHFRVRAIIDIDGHIIHQEESNRVIITSVDRDFHDFEVFICPQNRGQGDLSALENKLLIEMGNTGLYFGDNKLSTLSGINKLGIPWFERSSYVNKKEKYFSTKDKKHLHRINCFNDPTYWDVNTKTIQEAVSVNVKYGPVSYFANDEGSLTCYVDELDLCFCSHCMNKMRMWLMTEYSDLDALNISWGTEFKSWDQVEPKTILESDKSGNYASWGDHRRFMELVYAGAYERLRDEIRKIDPKGKVRMSGTQIPSPYSGYDYYLLHQVIGYFEAYVGGNQYELHRSFAVPGTVLGRWAGYGASGITAKSGIWTAVFHGLTLMSIFWEYSCLNFDYSYSQSAIDYADVFKEIRREGIGKLLLYAANRDSLGIVIHQSLNCMHGSYARKDLERYDNDRQGWLNVIEDLGYQYNIIAPQQIEKGMLSNGYKLLILPYAISLSEKEVQEIKTFVFNGGVVIGDFQTGIMNEHCMIFEKGSLDEVFGIKRFATDIRPFYVDNEFVANTDFPYFKCDNIMGNPDFRLTEYGTRVTTGKAAFHQDFNHAIPGVVINEYGKGKAIYLNNSLDKYPVSRTKAGGGSEIRGLIENLINLTDVEKYSVLRDKDGELLQKGYESFYYNDNSARYLGIMKDLGDTRRVSSDGLALGNVDISGSSADVVIIELKNKAHIYNIREKKYIGFTDTISTEILPGDTAVFALLPFTVDSITVKTRASVNVGEILDIEIDINSKKPDGEYKNVLNISFFDPEGNYEWIYGENIMIEGKKAAIQIKLPYNEKKGIWKVVAKDTATGVSTSAEFKVM